MAAVWMDAIRALGGFLAEGLLSPPLLAVAAEPAATDVMTAVAACATSLAAYIALAVGWSQLAEAKATRRDRAQPYVVAFVEHIATHVHRPNAQPNAFEFVIKNFGATAAYDISVEPSTLGRVENQGDSIGPLEVPTIPVLAPGQEWRAFWETSHRLDENQRAGRPELPATTLTVSYVERPSRGDARSHQTDARIDWAALRKQRFVTTTGDSDPPAQLKAIAKALRAIDSTLASTSD